MPYLWLVHCLLFHHFMKLLKYKQILLIYKFIYCTICFQLSFKFKLNFPWIISPKHYPILSIHPTECIGLIHPIHGGWLFLVFRSDMQFPEYNFLKSYKGVACALAFQVDLSVWTFYQSGFCEETCKQYEEKTCNRRGYCNFMHLKKTIEGGCISLGLSVLYHNMVCQICCSDWWLCDVMKENCEESCLGSYRR
jgi:hypothetical protein